MKETKEPPLSSIVSYGSSKTDRRAHLVTKTDNEALTRCNYEGYYHTTSTASALPYGAKGTLLEFDIKKSALSAKPVLKFKCLAYHKLVSFSRSSPPFSPKRQTLRRFRKRRSGVGRIALFFRGHHSSVDYDT